ncbi:unnamed protein product [Arabidopsis thaliana]|uniref:Sucrose-phosphatase n=1 Tax=Arabidopsis thaliana TaxID=3702 RepID=A0A7G2ESP5_ARATH|nr:unnamed protein product [Arabidopsis thaliana]
MDRLEGPPRLILVDHDDPENNDLLRFNALWEAHYRHDSLLVYCTGRSFSSYSSLRKKRPLLTPDIAVTSVGSEIVYGGGESTVSDVVWTARLDYKWNRDIVVEETLKFPKLEPQPDKSQEEHKVSFFVGREDAVEIMKVDVKLVYSNGYAFDVLPRGAGKQGALTYLLDKLDIEGKQPSNTLVCGDSGNDAELFNISDVYGVMVSNSHEELLQWYEENAKDNPKIFHASERCGAGMIEAIQRFNLGPNVSPRDVMDTENFHGESLNPAHEVVQFYLFYERWRCGEVEKSDKYLQNLKSLSSPLGIFVHPSGVEKPIHEWIDEMENLYGDGKEKKFRIWLDNVTSSHISSDTWLAKFVKHELSEGKVRSCSTKVLLSYKEEKQRLTWMHIHQSWLDESSSDDQEKWIF